MNLHDEGFRFVYRGYGCRWTHPAEVLPTDIDCTDMTDAEFDEFVRSHSFDGTDAQGESP